MSYLHSNYYYEKKNLCVEHGFLYTKKCQNMSYNTDFADYMLNNYSETNHFSSVLRAEEPNESTKTGDAGSYHSQFRHAFYAPHPNIPTIFLS